MNDNSILIIDDSNTNLVLLESLLKRNGYDVKSALSASEGLECMEKEVPGMIYLDLLMPEVDGFEFMRQVKQNDNWKNIPLVILSAVSDDKVIRKSLELGAVDYVTKPVNINQILRLTKNMLKN